MKNYIITAQDIEGMEKQFRTELVNSLPGFKSATLIGTVNAEGQTNLAVFSSFIHIGSNPPLFGFITRPTSVPRHTYLNIKSTGFFTANHIHPEIYQAAHQTSARYPENISEFDATGLTPEFSPNFPAPFVKESRIKLALEFVEEHPIAINGTILVIGKLCEAHFPEEILGKDGLLHIEKAASLTISGLDVYHYPQKIARLSYAKTDRPLQIRED
ncbi:MAG: flavin reductase [Bacteroidia bacterium]|nr:flavin reductase [Bacteroidia bacterium]